MAGLSGKLSDYYFTISKDGMSARMVFPTSRDATSTKLRLITAGIKCGPTLKVQEAFTRSGDEMVSMINILAPTS